MNIETIKPHSIGAWLIAIRPKTWGVAVAPVLAALAVSLSDTGIFYPLTALLTAALAVLMQIITNMENDAGYTKRKAERTNRKGLPRATSLGLLTVQEVEIGIKLLALIALLITGYFIYLTQWFFLTVTVLSIAAAYLYMGGPKPIAYTPFGELTVLIFFGLVATCGTYYLQQQTLSWVIVVVSFALGLIAAAVLCVNNYRDRVHDASIGRNTLCVVLGEKASLLAYQFMIFAPYALILMIVAFDPSRYPYLLVFLSLPKALPLAQELKSLTGEALNATLFATVKLEVFFALSLTIGALIHATLRWM